MRTTTNTFLSALVTLIILLINFGCSDVIVDPDINGPGGIADYKYNASEPFLYKFDLTNQTSFRLEGINGSVDVQSVPGTNQVTVSGEKVVSADSYQDAADHLRFVSIEINNLVDELFVKTLQPESASGRSYNVNYTINVPSDLNVTIKNVNGKLTGKLSVPPNGTIDMSLSNGSIELDIPQNSSADFSARLVNGNISVHNLTLKNKAETKRSLQGTLGDGEGLITLRTTNGNISAFGF